MKERCACLISINLKVDNMDLDLTYDVMEFPDDIEKVKSFTTHVTQDILNAVDVSRRKNLELIKEAKRASVGIGLQHLNRKKEK